VTDPVLLAATRAAAHVAARYPTVDRLELLGAAWEGCAAKVGRLDPSFTPRQQMSYLRAAGVDAARKEARRILGDSCNPRRLPALLDVEDPATGDGRHERMAVLEAFRGAMHRVAASSPGRHYLYLLAVEGCSVAEVAEECGVSESAVKTSVHRARRRING
jgi:RNA polymerase sigma factor (sigma-70 family)